jgi:hypothetical protein
MRLGGARSTARITPIHNEVRGVEDTKEMETIMHGPSVMGRGVLALCQNSKPMFCVSNLNRFSC